IIQVRLHAENGRGSLRLVPLRRNTTVGHIVEQRDARDARNNLAHDLDALGGELGDERAQTRDIPSRIGKARNRSSLDRLTARRPPEAETPGGPLWGGDR